MKILDVAGRKIGPGHPCFIVAEAGSNHNGNLAQAHALIDAAAEARADAVKFQLFTAARLYPRSAGRSEYLGLPRSIYEIIEEMELPPEWLGELSAHARDKGLVFFGAVFDEGAADLLDPYVELFKIASYEMTHLPLLRHVAAKGKPVILSTGTARLDEVRRSVQAFLATGNTELALLQCTARYPTPIEALNVRALVTLRETFAQPTGLSDHSRDPVLGPMTAVALGASIIEKHFTLSNRLPGPDHAFAVEPDELALLVRRVREVEAALGDGRKEVLEVEHELRSFSRRCLFTTRPVRAGESFTPDNVAALRRGVLDPGLEPEHLERVLTARAARDLPAESPITEEDLA
ncbi:MAG: N-acetylneuraminate synthase family protein [Acidobacteriota bacterium]|nr:N-acetylneuraminate synthase family protein [Acidobacteriota bacterium]